MQTGDVITVSLKRNKNGVFLKAIEKEWLDYIGFSDEEMQEETIDIVFKAEVSSHKGIKYIGFGKKHNQKAKDAEDML